MTQGNQDLIAMVLLLFPPAQLYLAFRSKLLQSQSNSANILRFVTMIISVFSVVLMNWFIKDILHFGYPYWFVFAPLLLMALIALRHANRISKTK